MLLGDNQTCQLATEAARPPTSSASADQPVELVFELAQHSNMKKDILRCRRAWPWFLSAPLQHLRGEIRHGKAGKIAAAAPKRTRGQLSEKLRWCLQLGGTVEPVLISFPVQFASSGSNKRLFKLWVFLSNIQENR